MGRGCWTMDTQQSETYRESIHREERRREGHKHKGINSEGVAHSGRTTWQDMGDCPPAFHSRAFIDTTEIQDKPPPPASKVTRGKTASTIGSAEKVNPHRNVDVDFAASTPGSACFSGVNPHAKPDSGPAKTALHGFEWKDGQLTQC